MSLYKRGNTWWVRFTTPSGKRIRVSSKNSCKKEALELHDRLKAEHWRSDHFGINPNHTWEEAAKMWLIEKRHKADYQKDISKLKWLAPYLGKKTLQSICREDIRKIAETKAREASEATANRYLALVRAILRKAVNDWEWIESAPKVHTFRESKRRIRWLTRDEARLLISELPEHQANIARFALATGLRQANITALSWSQVDLGREVAWIHPDQAKSGKAIAVPLNSDAVSVVRQQLGKHLHNVFTYKGRPIRQVNTKAWTKALHRAGISDFRWHDLRHTWASWHIQAGTPLHILQELGGWQCTEMVRRYAHLAPEHLAEHAARLVQGHNTDTIKGNGAVG